MSDNYPVDGELRRQAARIEAMEQAHAELAETVDQMISKAGTDCDKCEGRGWRINVPSQTMYPCTWCSGKGKVNIAAPAPDPVCPTCSKSLERNCMGQWQCYGCGEHGRHLNPEMTVPTAEPEPAPLDPVRSIMKLVLQYGADTANAAVCYRHNKDKEADDHNEKAYMRTQEIEAAIRAYGRDGAR